MPSGLELHGAETPAGASREARGSSKRERGAQRFLKNGTFAVPRRGGCDSLAADARRVRLVMNRQGRPSSVDVLLERPK